jgi:hypothetical protein
MTQIRITLNQIKGNDPCTSGWKKVLKSNGGLKADYDKPFPLSTALDSNDLDDTLWCLDLLPEHNKLWRKYAWWCASQVSYLTDDKRVHDCLAVVLRYSEGEATDEELRVARKGANASAADAAYATAAAYTAAAYTAAANTAAANTAAANTAAWAAAADADAAYAAYATAAAYTAAANTAAWAAAADADAAYAAAYAAAKVAADAAAYVAADAAAYVAAGARKAQGDKLRQILDAGKWV